MSVRLELLSRIQRPALLLVFCIGVSSPALADDNVVLQWNDAMLQAIRNTGFAPVRAAQGLAIMHTCMYDAWATYDRVAVRTQRTGWLRQPAGESTKPNTKKAVSHAAYRALVDLFPLDRDGDGIPDQQAALFDPLMERLGYDPVDTWTMPAAIGNARCDAVLEFRHADGSNQLGDMNDGAPYSDYTGYLPAPGNDPDHINDPSHWQPLRNPDGTVQQFLAPHWGLVAPFALAPADRYRPDPPAQYGTVAYQREADAVVRLSARLDDRTKAIALYWADGPSTETPPGHWNLFAQWVSRRDRHTLDEDVKMFFVLGTRSTSIQRGICT